MKPYVGPFYKPHEGVWRAMAAIAVLYMLFLVFLLFQVRKAMDEDTVEYRVRSQPLRIHRPFAQPYNIEGDAYVRRPL